MLDKFSPTFSDEPFNAGCFNITDDSLLGSPTSVDNIPGCAVECKNNNKRVSAWKDSSCYCLDAIPYNQIFYSDECIDFFLAGTMTPVVADRSSVCPNVAVVCLFVCCDKVKKNC